MIFLHRQIYPLKEKTLDLKPDSVIEYTHALQHCLLAWRSFIRNIWEEPGNVFRKSPSLPEDEIREKSSERHFPVLSGKRAGYNAGMIKERRVTQDRREDPQFFSQIHRILYYFPSYTRRGLGTMKAAFIYGT